MYLCGTMDKTLIRYHKAGSTIIFPIHAKDRLVSVLEGGYNLKALGKSVQTHIKVLMEIEVR